MDEERTIFTNKPAEIDWRTSDTITDEQIKAHSGDVFDNPSYTLDEKQLYSKDQMMQMFRLGAASITNMYMFKKFLEIERKKDKRTYHVMRNMKKGQIILLPLSAWNAARSAASYLKKDFGCRYVVNKRGYNNETAEIQVERLE